MLNVSSRLEEGVGGAGGGETIAWAVDRHEADAVVLEERGGDSWRGVEEQCWIFSSMFGYSDDVVAMRWSGPGLRESRWLGPKVK